MTLLELDEVIRCAEAETGKRIEAVQTEHGLELMAYDRPEWADDYDNSLIQGWKWV